MKVIYSIILLVLSLFTTSAQDISLANYRGELNIKLEVLDEKRLEKGVESLNTALRIEREALDLLKAMNDLEKIEGSSTNYKKMLKDFQEASTLFQEGHELIYTVYDENCTKFAEEMKKMNHYAAGMNKAKYYERKGERTIAKANAIREILLEADKPEWIQYKMHEAFELEKLAIRDKGRALQIYQDFPVEYNYGWDDDVTPQELARFFNNPAVNLPPEEVFKRTPPKQSRVPEGGPIEFRVQIAAHTVPLKEDYIRTFYTGTDTVKEVREGSWFKYQIGSFNNYQEADKLRLACRVPRAFVVAYQQDKKLTIKEALSKLQEVQ
jgi:tetratricopeptide (TPR) repeat protein